MGWPFPEIYVLRHGQTEWNALGRFQGHQDSPLTDLGRQQAQAQGRILAGIELSELLLISSPQGRALETARLALGAQAHKLRTDDRLMEIDVGAWTGADRDSLPAYPDLAEDPKGALEIYENAPGGEGFDALKQRCMSFLQELNRPAVLVTHGITSRMLRVLHLGLDIEDLGVIPGGQGNIHHLSSGSQTILRAPEITTH